MKQPNDLALIINFRQTLMITYSIYSAIGYMGNEVGNIFANLENKTKINSNIERGIKNELGVVDVYLWNEQTTQWEL